MRDTVPPLDGLADTFSPASKLAGILWGKRGGIEKPQSVIAFLREHQISEIEITTQEGSETVTLDSLEGMEKVEPGRSQAIWDALSQKATNIVNQQHVSPQPA